MKKVRFIPVVFILVVSISFFLMQNGERKNSAASAIQSAFTAIGARVVASDIYILGKADPQLCDSRKERQFMLEGVIRGAGGNTEASIPVFSEIDADAGTGTQTDYIIDNDSRIHASIMIGKGGDSSVAAQVTANLVNTSQTQMLQESAAVLEAALKEYCGETSVNICITGSISGYLDEAEVDEVCRIILESTEADKVEGLKEKGLVSVSAYSPDIGNAVRVNGKRINLNLAVRYNSYEGRTYIWLASPVITTEY